MCVSDTKAVDNVLFGPQGVEGSLTAGMTIVDSSTISPSTTRQNAERVQARGAHYVDAPMTGSKVAAEGGTLIFIVGGEESAIANPEAAPGRHGQAVLLSRKRGRQRSGGKAGHEPANRHDLWGGFLPRP